MIKRKIYRKLSYVLAVAGCVTMLGGCGAAQQTAQLTDADKDLMISMSEDLLNSLDNGAALSVVGTVEGKASERKYNELVDFVKNDAELLKLAKDAYPPETDDEQGTEESVKLFVNAAIQYYLLFVENSTVESDGTTIVFCPVCTTEKEEVVIIETTADYDKHLKECMGRWYQEDFFNISLWNKVVEILGA